MFAFYADPVISDPRLRMSLEDKRWNEYDETIKNEVAFYNRKFNGKSGFIPLDWRWVKAMLWTEVLAGPNESKGQWQQLPMQIGVIKGGVTDPGYAVVRDAKQDEGADLVVEDELKQKIQNRADVIGHLNVRTGIAYLFIRAAIEVGAYPDKIDDPQILTDIVGAKEGLDAVAVRLKTTTDNIIQNTQGLTKQTILHAGDSIKYQKSHSVRGILRWDDWDTAVKNYNSETTDPKYREKVSRAYQIILSRTSK